MSIDYTPPGPICGAYVSDGSPVSLIEGPVGSGKTVGTLMKGFIKSVQQKAFQGVRYSRGMFLRNTYPELKSTVIKSFQDWFPENIAPIKWDAPISATMKFPLADGTRLDLEIYFLSFDRPDDIGKLKSLEVTWAGLSEANELAKAALDMSSQRVGRYPPARLGGPSWYGVFGDTNMPDDDHYLYNLFEKEKARGYKLFRQPGGLIFNGGDIADLENYEPNPLAENIANLPGGYEYYFRQIPGKAKEWIKVFLLAQYGTVSDGKAIYPEWNDDIHCKKAAPYPGRPLLLGFDYGLTPACVVCQVSPRGQLVVLAELFAKDMGIRQFARDVIRPFLAMNFHDYGFQAAGDPAGLARSDTDEKTCFMELAEEGIACVPASTNTFVGRREAVAKYLTRLVDGQPALLVDPSCDMIRRGFNGRYQYRRLQVVGEERYKDVPDKNDFSHLHDALQYAALHSLNMNQGSDWSTKITYPKGGFI
jgi:hypothetical protein